MGNQQSRQTDEDESRKSSVRSQGQDTPLASPEEEGKPFIAPSQYRKRKVFVSYAPDVKNEVFKLVEQLRRLGYMHIWMDVHRLTSNMMEDFGQMLDETAAVIVCFSHKFNESTWCEAELNYIHENNVPWVACCMQQDIQLSQDILDKLGERACINMYEGQYDTKMLVGKLDKLLQLSKKTLAPHEQNLDTLQELDEPEDARSNKRSTAGKKTENPGAESNTKRSVGGRKTSFPENSAILPVSAGNTGEHAANKPARNKPEQSKQLRNHDFGVIAARSKQAPETIQEEQNLSDQEEDSDDESSRGIAPAPLTRTSDLPPYRASEQYGDDSTVDEIRRLISELKSEDEEEAGQAADSLGWRLAYSPDVSGISFNEGATKPLLKIIRYSADNTNKANAAEALAMITWRVGDASKELFDTDALHIIGDLLQIEDEDCKLRAAAIIGNVCHDVLPARDQMRQSQNVLTSLMEMTASGNNSCRANAELALANIRK